jgi:CelD/BcsL family acetyltransferase involved in cellulose biosynthesis
MAARRILRDPVRMLHKGAAQIPKLASWTSLVPGAEVAGGDIAVQFLTSADEFARLAPEWNRIHAQAAAASVFNSWLFQYQWWQVYGGEQPLRILVALEHGETVGILALYIQKLTVLGVPVRILRFVGTGADTHPDDLGPVLAPGREEMVARKLARAALRLSDADAVVLSDIDPQSVFPPALEQAAAEANRASLSEVSERIAFVELPRSWPQFLESLSSDRRTRIRSARKKAAAAHQLRFYVWDDSAGLDHAVDRLTELHRSRWQDAGGSASFATPEYIEFHRRSIKSAFPRGWLRLYCLELDGEIAAITYCYRFRNHVYLMQAGFDPAKAKSNPGKVLLGYALEHAIAEGNEVFDFLKGEHRYKDQLATGYRSTRGVRVFRNTPGGLAYRLRKIWLPRWKARVYGRPPPKLML